VLSLRTNSGFGNCVGFRGEPDVSFTATVADGCLVGEPKPPADNNGGGQTANNGARNQRRHARDFLFKEKRSMTED
jgi:hypothetical protein